MGTAQLDPETRIVIIGAGVVGAALADDLVRVHGMRQVTVVDQGPLYTTGGASSHAPGFAFQTTGSEVMSELAKRTIDKLDGITLDGEWVMKRVGGLELASTPERLNYLQRRYDLAQSWGIPSELVDAERCGELFPGLDTTAVLGGFHTPTDAVVKSVRAVEVQARRAIEHGATIYGLTEVTDVRIEGGKVVGVEVRAVPPVVSIPSKGDTLPEGTDFIPADLVIACTGMWGPRLGEKLGLELPMIPMEHCESWTSALPDGGIDPAVECELPILRHQESGLYLRQYGAGYIWGSYEHRIIPVEQSAIAAPDEFSRTGIHPAIHPVSRDDLADTWANVNRLLPETSEVAHVDGMNGIFSFTPDGNPLIGDVDGVEGLWLGLSVWLTQSAGVAEILANWIVTGDAGIDTAPLDYRRYDQAHLTHSGSLAWSGESRGESYRIAHPRKHTAQLRGLAVSPFYPRQQQLDATFALVGGFERPLWYGDTQTRVTGNVEGSWSDFGSSEQEHEEARSAYAGVGIADIANVGILEVAADPKSLSNVFDWDAAPTLGSVTTARLLTAAGGIAGDYTAIRTGDELFLLLTNTPRDLQRIAAALPGARVSDVSDAYTGLHLIGPGAGDLLRSVASSTDGLHAGSSQILDLGGAPARAVISPVASEADVKLLFAPQHGLHVWDRLFAAEPAPLPIGTEAHTALRIAAGIPSFGVDFDEADTLADAGLGGGEIREGRRPLVLLELDDEGDPGLVYGQPVRKDGAVVGFITSAGQDPQIGKGRAFARVDANVAVTDTRVEAFSPGRAHGARIVTLPLSPYVRVHQTEMKNA